MSTSMLSTLTKYDESFNDWRRSTNKTVLSIGDLSTIYTTDGSGGDQVSVTLPKYTIGTIANIVVNGLDATVTLNSEHNLRKYGSAYDTITIAGVTPSGFNGTFAVTTIVDDLSFSVHYAAPPGTYTSGGTLTFSTSDVLAVLNDVNARKVKRTGDSISYLNVTNATASTSKTTGALIVTGGGGFGGNVWANSIQGTPIGSTTAASGAFTTLTALTPSVNANTTDAATTAWYMSQGSQTNPSMDASSANYGASTYWARADHAHPWDTSRLAKAGDTATGKITFPAASGSISGSLNIPVGSGNVAVSGDVYNIAGALLYHNGTAVKTVAYTDSNITGTATNVTGTVPVVNGGTGLSSMGGANKILGINNSGNAMVYRSFNTSSTISISIDDNGVTFNATGTMPSASITPNTHVIGQNVLVGGLSSATPTYNSVVTTNALEVRPWYTTANITNLLKLTSDTAGSSTVFNVDMNGSLIIGANKFTVNGSTGSTNIAGDLAVSGNFNNNATFLGTIQSTGNATLGTSVGNVLSHGSFAAQITYQLNSTTTTPNQILASIPGATYRTAKFLIQVSLDSGGSYQSAEILAVHDGSQADHTEYAVVSKGSLLATFSVDYSGGNLRLLTTPQQVANTTFRATAHLTKV